MLISIQVTLIIIGLILAGINITIVFMTYQNIENNEFKQRILEQLGRQTKKPNVITKQISYIPRSAIEEETTRYRLLFQANMIRDIGRDKPVHDKEIVCNNVAQLLESLANTDILVMMNKEDTRKHQE